MARSEHRYTGGLATPERNNFFYGKLLDVDHLRMEQRYFNEKRWLLNRFVFGSGVVCGLKVLVQDDMVEVEPGLAIDGLGREIFVPDLVSIDPRLVTDEQGKPTGETISTGITEICLIYNERKLDPVPVLVPDCDTPGNCAPSTIEESFRFHVRAVKGERPEAPGCNEKDFPSLAEKDFNLTLHKLICQRNFSCGEPPADPCVPIARVTLNDSLSVDPVLGRPIVYSNALLYEIILCLVERLRVTET